MKIVRLDDISEMIDEKVKELESSAEELIQERDNQEDADKRLYAAFTLKELRAQFHANCEEFDDYGFE